ncbi:hypothetical protein FE784_12730 [Paenibacillus hemerocallicola]|uniref:Uncharacterized protein n=1 Tax=Paenibacillus hemerocallicola TaxID=1172614 RepID=A0A5C4TAG5_9BACL|nr:DUF5957 family protein [Paenibacillus hemerocallicola]TNJ66043.1 hypothetical protein FE784_12730 [Paenibacillus hemerocallicola]
MNKKIRVVLLAMVGGLIGGFVLAEIIGIAGILLTGRAIGVKFLPFILPFVCAGIALLAVQSKLPPR